MVQEPTWFEQHVLQLGIGVATFFVGWLSWVSIKVMSLSNRQTASEGRDEAHRDRDEETMRMFDLILDRMKENREQGRVENAQLREEVQENREQGRAEHAQLREDVRVLHQLLNQQR